MKKLFAIFAAALIAFGMSSCKGGQNEPEKKEGFTIEVSKITAKTATVKVTPADTSVSYFSQVVAKTVYDQYKGDDAKFFEDIQKSVKEEYKYAGSIAGWVKGGEHTYVQGDLLAEVEYLAVVMPMDKEGNIPVGAKLYSKAFTTEKAPLTLEVRINSVTTSTVNFSIIPSDSKSSFFFNFVVQAVADGREDADLIAEAKEMSAEERDNYMWTFGELIEAIHPGLVPDVPYVLYAFFMDKDGNVPTGAKVVRANFRTDAE